MLDDTHITKFRSRADVFSTVALAMDARERLFPQPDLTACYTGGTAQGHRCYYVELFDGSDSIGYLRERRSE